MLTSIWTLVDNVKAQDNSLFSFTGTILIFICKSWVLTQVRQRENMASWKQLCVLIFQRVDFQWSTRPGISVRWKVHFWTWSCIVVSFVFLFTLANMWAGLWAPHVNVDWRAVVRSLKEHRFYLVDYVLSSVTFWNMIIFHKFFKNYRLWKKRHV